MLVRHHSVLAVVLFLLLYFVFGIDVILSLVASLASVLIDFDHYLIYVVEEKDFSLKRAVKWHVEKPRYPLLVFHTVYFFIFMFAVLFVLKEHDVYVFSVSAYSLWLTILFGMLYHLFFDILWALLGIIGVLGKEEQEKAYPTLINRLFAVRIKKDNKRSS